jgi:hypothetical protein
LACSVAYSHVGVTYQRNSTSVLIPGTTSYPQGDNPYLYIGNLSQASDVLVGALGAEKAQEPILKEYPGSTITVTRDQATSGPMISITVTAPTNRAAAGALDAIDAQIAPALATMQTEAAVPKNALIKVVPVTADGSSQVSQKTKLEVVGIIGVIGLVITLLLAALIDSLILTWRARRRAAAAAAAATAAAGFRITDSSTDTHNPPRPGKPVKKSTKNSPSVPARSDGWSDN